MRRYVPWIRTGAATAISAVDPLDGPPVPERAQISVTTDVNNGAGAATVAIRLFGPGDVTGVDQRQVIGVDPAPGTTNAEPNYFPVIDLRSPALPWLFTPAAPTTDGRLRPWLRLVVVRADAAELVVDASRPLPVLRVDAGAELPDPGQSWAWAHVQISGDGDIAAALSGSDSSVASSRLIAPRRLERGTAYLAAVVPAFAAGRAIGLGQRVDDAAAPGPLVPAWSASDGLVELPVYHSWHFMTGPAGDFEALVARLRKASGGPVAATQDLTIVGLSAGLPDLGVVPMPGALGIGDETWAPTAVFTVMLSQLLNLPEPMPAGASVPTGLVLPPPTYGRWHAGRRVGPSANPNDWLSQLNLDPRYRAAAGLGAKVVREKQETLMASAWRQIGPVLAANKVLRQAQLARGAGAALHAQSFVGLPAAALMLLTEPVHDRVLAGPITVAATVAQSRVPRALVSPAMRRVARSRGPLARRFGGPDAARLLARVNSGVLTAGSPRPAPNGLVTADSIAATDGRPRLCSITPGVVGQSEAQLVDPLWDLWRKAAGAHQARLPGCEPPLPVPRPALDLAGLGQTLSQELRPAKTVTARVKARITRPDGWQRSDPLEPILAAPSFPTAMYRDLADTAPELLLPGVTGLPPDSVSAVSTNPRFVEAFMVGLNHEMGRELVWRGYPTDQRGTCFRQFWDRSGAVPVATTEAERAARLDIPLVTDWTGPLGSHMRDARQLVVIVRGELLRRYPETVVYATRAAWIQEDGQWVRRPEVVVDHPTTPRPGQESFAERYPDFVGSLPPDVTLFGFGVDPAQAVGSSDRTDDQPGWFLVFQQPFTQTRYGLDEQAPTDPTGTWRDLAWPHVQTDAAGYVRLAPLPAPPAGPNITSPNGLVWADTANGAQVAAMVEQPPYRIAIHASDLLPGQPS